MPGYTHLQRAQPVTLGQHLLAWVEMLERDRARFAFAADAGDAESPLGAGALAGSTLPLPPPASSAELARRGRRPRLRARLPVRGRGAASRTCRGSARSSCLWSTAEFGFVRLPRGGGDGLVDDAAEAESRRRRARARQGRDGDRAADRAARDRQGPAARVRPRPAGGQAAGLRARGATCGGALGALTVLVAGSSSTASGSRRRPPTRCCSRPTPPRRWSREGVPFRDAHEQVARAVREGTFEPDSTAAESVAARLGGRRRRGRCGAGPARLARDRLRRAGALRHRHGGGRRRASARSRTFGPLCSRSTREPCPRSIRSNTPSRRTCT